MISKRPKRDTGILSWAEADRPREKLLMKGKAALSDAELIAILIGSGTTSLSAVDVGKALLKAANHNLNELARFSLNDLKKIPGIGEAKAVTIMSALELGRRRKEADSLKREQIRSSQDAYQCIRAELLDLPHEEFWVILMNRANMVLKKVPISKGGVSGTVADPKIIFKVALESSASSLILVHNHPSGNLQPSEADKRLTRKMVEGGKMLDLPVLDHLIFTNHGYYSFADEGML